MVMAMAMVIVMDNVLMGIMQHSWDIWLEGTHYIVLLPYKPLFRNGNGNGNVNGNCNGQCNGYHATQLWDLVVGDPLVLLPSLLPPFFDLPTLNAVQRWYKGPFCNQIDAGGGDGNDDGGFEFVK